MSWNCEICGEGWESDHRLCKLTIGLTELSERIDKLIEVLELTNKVRTQPRRNCQDKC